MVYGIRAKLVHLNPPSSRLSTRTTQAHSVDGNGGHDASSETFQLSVAAQKKCIESVDPRMSLARLVGEKNAEPPRLMIRVDPSPGCLAWHHLDEKIGIYLLMFVYMFIFSYFFPYDPCLSVCHQGISRTSTPFNIHISPRQVSKVSKPALNSNKCIMTQHPSSWYVSTKWSS